MPADARRMAVIGNGRIGHGIAEIFAKAGWHVSLIGRSRESLAQAVENARQSLASFVESGLLTIPEADAASSRITPATTLSAAADAGLVIEALPEDMALKQQVFRDLDAMCSFDAVLASSSGHPASALDHLVRRKDRVIATHFWFPPQLIPLVEVCGSKVTSKAVVERTCEMLRGAGKEPVVIDREVPGFVGNRIQFAALREAWSLWAQGVASAEAIDAVVRNSFGRRLAVTGPIESADLAGLKTMYEFARALQPDLDKSPEPPAELRTLIEGGRGVYDWTKRDAKKLLQARRDDLIHRLKAEKR